MERYRIVRDPETGEGYLPVAVRGTALKHDPMLNKGSGFSEEERDALGLRGLVPPAYSSLHQQLERVYENYLGQPSDLARYLYLVALQDRNETLFYRIVLEHLEEMLPIIYTPTVGLACERFSHIYRRSRGLFVTPADIDRVGAVMANAPFRDVAIIVATDNEGILGIGDQGAGGMGIPIGKLSLYTVAAGIHPSRCLPISIDVGTNNPALRADPLYLGMRHERIRGELYDRTIEALVQAVRSQFPAAVLQWEDFSRQNAWTVLERYRERICSFNDDVQGTGAVVLAGLLEAEHLLGEPLTEQRYCVHGAGAAGAGIANSIALALEEKGLTRRQALDRIVALDSQGLLLSDRKGIEPYKQFLARDRNLVADWKLERPGRVDLADVVREFHPTVLIGTSGQAGCFTQAVVEQMGRNADRPVIFALSNPTSKTEVHPKDALRFTEGRALVATGSPFQPVELDGRHFQVAQCNNVLCFPGIGLGVIACRAVRVTDRMLRAAARAVSEHVSPEERAAGRLYPQVRRIRGISRAVALAVAREAVAEGAVVEPLALEQIERRVDDEIWYPEYVPYRAV